jgi:hypothetical protein
MDKRQKDRHMNKRTNGETVSQTDRRTIRQAKRQTNKQTDSETDSQTDRRAFRQRKREMNKQTDSENRRTNRQIDRPTVKQTEEHSDWKKSTTRQKGRIGVEQIEERTGESTDLQTYR